MQITQVEPQKTLRLRSGHKRFNIYLDGKFAFGADEDLVVEKRLVVGKIIEPQGLEKLLFEAEMGKWMGKMYRLFGVRMRSEREVRNYLKVKSLKLKVKKEEEISELVIESLVEKLKQKGLINDEVFARAWVEARRASKKKGINAIKAELYQKGIAREIIEEVLSEGGDSESEEALAKEALEKKMRVWKNLPPLEFKKKAVEFLLRRGFEYSVAKEVADKFINKEV